MLVDGRKLAQDRAKRSNIAKAFAFETAKPILRAAPMSCGDPRLSSVGAALSAQRNVGSRLLEWDARWRKEAKRLKALHD
jgi:hypothetical protein